MNIINGYRNNPHITSQQLRNTYIPIFGKDAYILDVGSKMEVTVISANEIEIADGQLICEGCTAEIAHGTTESLTIDNGAQGKQRIDLIVARYTKDSGTGVEDMQLAVVKGTPAASNPAVPTYNTGTIADGDSPVDFPIYQVNIDGISITSVEPLVDTVSVADAISTMHGQIEALQKLSIKAVQVDFGSQGFNSNGVIDRSKNVSNEIPSGYRLLCALPLHSGHSKAVIFSCTVVEEAAIRIQVKRLDNSLATSEPHALILCVNRGMV